VLSCIQQWDGCVMMVRRAPFGLWHFASSSFLYGANQAPPLYPGLYTLYTSPIARVWSHPPSFFITETREEIRCREVDFSKNFQTVSSPETRRTRILVAKTPKGRNSYRKCLPDSQSTYIGSLWMQC
jgi:hypothetical protein